MALLLSLSALGGAAAGSAQEPPVWPERGENLEVLPADFSGERIRAVMLGFSRALGEAYARGLALAPAADGLRAKPAALPDAAPPSGTGSGWRADAAVRGPGGRPLEVSVLATDVRVPASLSFLPDGTALVADRAAPALYLLEPASGTLTAVEGLPPIGAFGDAGLHEVVPDPGFEDNRRVYLSYTAPGEDDTYALVVARATLEDGRLSGLEPIFTALPFLERALGHHYGGRMVVDGEHLFLTSGDRDHRVLPQALDNHVGKVLRIHTDGSVPADNPFVDRPGARPEIWTYGHRNPQGLDRHPLTGELWSTEHGPRGGDEMNVLRAGANYGWPLVSFGHEYEGGAVGEGRTFMEGAEAPRHVWTPSIGPSDLVFHSGRGAPEWAGSALVGAMALRHLNRVELDGGAMRVEERLLGGRGHRIRAVAESPDGTLFLAADGGAILRLRPTP